jgi:hypothetical protein
MSRLWAPAGPDEFLGGVTSADFGGQGDAVFVGVGEGRCQPTPGGLLLDESFLLDLTNGGSVVREVGLHRDRGYGGVLAVGHAQWRSGSYTAV